MTVTLAPSAAPQSTLPQPESLRRFADSLGALLAATADEDRIIHEGRALLAQLVARDDWLPEAATRPHPDHYCQYLLHLDPDERFSVVSFVWGPGQETPVHDHTVWGLVGMLRGVEVEQRYRLGADGRPAKTGEAVRLLPGQVAAVSPRIGDIHRVSNALADRTSISIHVYGGNIGAIGRSVFLEDGVVKPFVSGYTPMSPVSDVAPDVAPDAAPRFATATYGEVRALLLTGAEIALLDVREEDPYANGHPLWAANLPLARIELDAWTRIPRRDTPIVVYGEAEGEDLAPRAAAALARLGYGDVRLLAGGLAGWRAGGGQGAEGELFIDVNVPSKAFGELVEATRHTPSLSAQEVKALIDARADVVIVDARRFDEYQTMSIPTATSVPGAELVLRVRALAPDPATRVIVNCAGRTRSIIGAQSLINAGLPNPVAALRNGTIGWTLAGQALDHGAARRFPDAIDPAQRAQTRHDARAVAVRAGVRRVALAGLVVPGGRTLYRFDVRTPQEYAAGHLPGFLSAPGGQLVQELDHHAPVRGARIALADDDGVRADMTASWLAQMGWDVCVVEADPGDFTEAGQPPRAAPPPPAVDEVSVAALADWLRDAPQGVAVIDLTASAHYVKSHIPGAWFALRSDLRGALARIPAARRYVLTCASSLLARFAAPEARALLPASAQVLVLTGGTAAWIDAGQPAESGETRLASARIDRYRRPYEGVNNAFTAMQAYLDWEYGLVEQLKRDGTHRFRVI